MAYYKKLLMKKNKGNNMRNLTDRNANFSFTFNFTFFTGKDVLSLLNKV